MIPFTSILKEYVSLFFDYENLSEDRKDEINSMSSCLQYSIIMHYTTAMISDEKRRCCYAFGKLHGHIQDVLQLPTVVLASGSSSEGIPFNDVDKMIYKGGVPRTYDFRYP